MLTVSQRLLPIVSSPTIRLDSQAKALHAAGQPVINLTAGELDFDTPAAVLDRAQSVVHEQQNKYSPPAGLPSVRQAIQHYLADRHQLKFTTDQIIVTNGAKQALYSCFQVLINPGDEVLVLQPGWVSYTEQIKLAGGRPVAVNTTSAGWPDVEALHRAVTVRTRGVVLNYPNNPTGVVYAATLLQQLADWAQQHNLWVISDEIYEQILYDGVPFTSFAHVYPDATVIVNGVSKAGAMTGWRMGFAAGPSAIIDLMITLQSHLAGNVANIVQLAGAAALQLDHQVMTNFVTQLTARRALVRQWLEQQPRLQSIQPQGAFYYFINIQSVEKSSEVFCEQLLQQQHVALVPGKYFGWEGYVRLSFAAATSAITTALDRLTMYLASYPSV